MGNKTKKFRQISTNVHRTGCRRNKQEKTIRHAWARKGGPPPFKASETEQLPYRAWTRKSRAVLRETALLRANSPKRRCKTSLSHAKRRLATRRHLCCLALRWVSSGTKREKTSASSHFRRICAKRCNDAPALPERLMNPQGKICKTTRFQFKNYEERQNYS